MRIERDAQPALAIRKPDIYRQRLGPRLRFDVDRSGGDNDLWRWRADLVAALRRGGSLCGGGGDDERALYRADSVIFYPIRNVHTDEQPAASRRRRSLHGRKSRHRRRRRSPRSHRWNRIRADISEAEPIEKYAHERPQELPVRDEPAELQGNDSHVRAGSG
jgi:hypothetical protein